MKNLTIKVPALTIKTYKKIEDYIDSDTFQKDFLAAYPETEGGIPGRILDINYEAYTSECIMEKVKISFEKSLINEEIDKNMGKLIHHYKNILKMILTD